MTIHIYFIYLYFQSCIVPAAGPPQHLRLSVFIFSQLFLSRLSVMRAVVTSVIIIQVCRFCYLFTYFLSLRQLFVNCIPSSFRRHNCNVKNPSQKITSNGVLGRRNSSNISELPTRTVLVCSVQSWSAKLYHYVGIQTATHLFCCCALGHRACVPHFRATEEALSAAL